MISGTIKNSVKLQMLDSKWQQKKNEINANKPQKELTPEEQTIAQFKEQMEKERESSSHADTYNKLASGGELTPDEISYLREHDPEALAKYEEAQAEKKSYENALKNCKTKDEVERLKMNHMGQFAAQAKKITNDPYIPLDKKLELMNQLNNKVCLINEAHLEFLDSEQYKDMPTDQELSKERIDEASKNLDKMQEEVEASVLENTKEDTSYADGADKDRVSDKDRGNGTNRETSNDKGNDIDKTSDKYSGVDEVMSTETTASTTSKTSKGLSIPMKKSAEEDMKKAEREKKDFNETVKESDQDISYEKISDSIRKFVISSGNCNSKINIGL